MQDRNEHRSVAGIAYEDCRVFVARRVPGGAIGGRWEFPGGKVESGEDDRAALEREYLEEFGVPVQVGDELASARFRHKGKNRILTAYRVRFATVGIKLREHTEWRWTTLADTEELDLADSDRKLLEGLKACLGQ